jgi:hypothetical protein
MGCSVPVGERDSGVTMVAPKLRLIRCAGRDGLPRFERFDWFDWFDWFDRFESKP